MSQKRGRLRGRGSGIQGQAGALEPPALPRAQGSPPLAPQCVTWLVTPRGWQDLPRLGTGSVRGGHLSVHSSCSWGDGFAELCGGAPGRGAAPLRWGRPAALSPPAPARPLTVARGCHVVAGGGDSPRLHCSPTRGGGRGWRAAGREEGGTSRQESSGREEGRLGRLTRRARHTEEAGDLLQVTTEWGGGRAGPMSLWVADLQMYVTQIM